MKLIRLNREQVCRKSKQSTFKIDRSDLWGDPEEYENSLLAQYQKFFKDGEETQSQFVKPEDSRQSQAGLGSLFKFSRSKGASDQAGEAAEKIVRVVYLYGQGGLGKSFVCRETAKRFSEEYSGELYTIVLDLRQQREVEDNLKCLADAISEQAGGSDLFPRFLLAYYRYKLREGEQKEAPRSNTKVDELHESNSYGLVSGIIKMTPLGGVTDFVDTLYAGYRNIRDKYDEKLYQDFIYEIETMDDRELRRQLVRYFAEDFCDYMDRRREKKSFVILLDTIESMRYHALRSASGEDYLEWLVGINGLIRLLPDCFWILFGREEILWEKYEYDNELQDESFRSIEFTRPGEQEVRKYLLKQFGRMGIGGEEYAADNALHEIIDEIILQTDCYPLAVENCVEVYFRIWNKKLRDHKVTDEDKAEEYRPQPEEIKEMFSDKKGKKIISNRFMKYYTQQEQEVLYTLICLETWTDRILESLIWKNTVSNTLVYEEMCSTSFIKTGDDGRKFVQGLMLEAIMEECPQNLKKNLLSCIVGQMKIMEIDDTYCLLYHSALHIIRYSEQENLNLDLWNSESIRFMRYLTEHAQFAELLELCVNLLDALKDSDTDLCNAARIGHFVHVIQKDGKEEFATLQGKEQIGGCSVQVWRMLNKIISKMEVYEQAYQIADYLAERLSDQSAGATMDRFLVMASREEYMRGLKGRFEASQIEEAFQETRSLSDQLPSEYDRNEVGKLKAYYEFNHYTHLHPAGQELSEIEEKRIEELLDGCIDRYRACCTSEEARRDWNLCFMELDKYLCLGRIDLQREVAEKWIQILPDTYGEKVVRHPDMRKLLIIWFVSGSRIGRYYKQIDKDVAQRDGELLHRILKIYYESFYKDGYWKAFDTIQFYKLNPLWNNEDREELLQQGILYLTNSDSDMWSNIHVQLKLLASYTLMEKIWWLGRWEKLSAFQFIQQQMVNDLALLYFLKKETEDICMNNHPKETERLSVFIRAILCRLIRHGGTEKDKSYIYGLLKWCGIDVDREVWSEENQIKSQEAKATRIIDVLRGWEWKMDSQTDLWMINIMLYVASSLGLEQAESDILKFIRDGKVNSTSYRSDDVGYIQLWNGILEEAKEYGEAWEQHVYELFQQDVERLYKKRERLKTDVQKELAKYDSRFKDDVPEKVTEDIEDKLIAYFEKEDYEGANQEVIKFFDSLGKGSNSLVYTVAFYDLIINNRGTDGFVEEVEKWCNRAKAESMLLKTKPYWILKAYMYLNDRENFLHYYRENCQEIWEDFDSVYIFVDFDQFFRFFLDCGEMELFIECLRHFFDKCLKRCYPEILYQLKQVTKYIPFEEIWDRKACKIKEDNYEEIYELLKDYLTKDELFDIFMEAVKEITFCYHDYYDSGRFKFSFCESGYAKWLQETFPEEIEKRKDSKDIKDWMEMITAKADYEKNWKRNYHYHINKAKKEIKDIIMKYQQRAQSEACDIVQS